MTLTFRIFRRILFFTAILLAGGCARQHTVQTEGNSLVFHYRDTEAKEIILVSSQDNFIYHPASRQGGDLWVVSLPLGDEFSYFYIVDGRVTLPECPNTILDDFGGKNCFYDRTL